MEGSLANGQCEIWSSRRVGGMVALMRKEFEMPPARENFSIRAGQRNSTLPRSKTELRGNLRVRRFGRSWMWVKRDSRGTDWETRERSRRRSFLQWPRATRQMYPNDAWGATNSSRDPWVRRRRRAVKEGLLSWMMWERSRRRTRDERGEGLTFVDVGEMVMANFE